ncbi:hypothetical protein ACFPM3_18895 [Streptomyces coeruleoprunus]|uniref:Transposase n=1 Tax=Streptomyces coeruleoprunus TaxID=285563 RepID=A0ABV9XFK4_9ACTN
MDADDVADELYALPPSEFIAARDARVAEARRAEDADAAARIARLRRPSLAAWASNLLVRGARTEAAKLPELGQALREAHRTLDPEQFRELSHQQHRVVAALSRRAGELAAEAGQPVSETVLHEVERTLHAVLADPDAAEEWARGRLVKTLEAPVGFAGMTPESAAAPATRRGAPAAPPAREGGTPSRERARDRERARERKRTVDRARSAAEEAEAEADRRQRELDRAEQARQASTARAAEATAHVKDLETRLHEARTAQREAQAQADKDTTTVREADRAARQARKAADTAAAGLRRLSGSEEAGEETGEKAPGRRRGGG